MNRKKQSKPQLAIQTAKLEKTPSFHLAEYKGNTVHKRGY